MDGNEDVKGYSYKDGKVEGTLSVHDYQVPYPCGPAEERLLELNKHRFEYTETDQEPHQRRMADFGDDFPEIHDQVISMKLYKKTPLEDPPDETA